MIIVICSGNSLKQKVKKKHSSSNVIDIVRLYHKNPKENEIVLNHVTLNPSGHLKCYYNVPLTFLLIFYLRCV